jgi:hypothetical protein
MLVNPMARLSGGDYECNIKKEGDNLKLMYKYRDSVSNAYYRDKRTRPLLESYLSSRSEMTMDSIRSIESEYSFYREDSIDVSVNKYASFVELLKKIIITPKESLEDLEADKKKPVLDGEYYTFYIQSSKGKMIVNSINLDAKLHPELHRLIVEAIDIYQKEKQRNFFTNR